MRTISTYRKSGRLFILRVIRCYDNHLSFSPLQCSAMLYADSCRSASFDLHALSWWRRCSSASRLGASSEEDRHDENETDGLSCKHPAVCSYRTFSSELGQRRQAFAHP